MDLRRLTAALAVALLTAVPATAQSLAKDLFGAERQGSPHQSQVIGFYSRGCLAGGQELAETGPTWQAMRLSRNRNWGHPDLVAFIQDLSKKAAQLPGWNGIYVGDMNQPRGGPMLTGHRSHQSGIDADIWLRPGTDMRLSRQTREDISSVEMDRNGGAFVNQNWTRAHHDLLKAAAEDPRVQRIFIFPGAKVQMCKDARGNREWLRKIRPIGGHNYHFHVRLNCPKGSPSCEGQAPPPKGDGCADAQAWVNNILNPPPPDPNAKPAPARKHPRQFTMADLPQQCRAVLSN